MSEEQRICLGRRRIRKEGLSVTSWHRMCKGKETGSEGTNKTHLDENLDVNHFQGKVAQKEN